MGRQKKVHKRFVIGLDKVRAQVIIDMSFGLGLTYSEVVGLLLDYYQLGKNEVAGK